MKPPELGEGVVTCEEHTIRGVPVRIAAVTHEGTHADPVSRTLISWHAHFDGSEWGETLELRHPVFSDEWESTLWRLYGSALASIEAAKGVTRGTSAAVVDAAVRWAQQGARSRWSTDGSLALFDAVAESREKTKPSG